MSCDVLTRQARGRVTYHGRLWTRRTVLLTAKEARRFLGFVFIHDRPICTLTLMKYTKIFLVSSSKENNIWTPKLNLQNEHYTSVDQHLQDNSATKSFKIKHDRQRTYKRNIEARSRNHCCRGKAISITHSDCVSAALVIQYAKRMRRITLSSVACLILTYFSTLFHKRHDFRK
jgi:hypothetical protein